MNTTIEEPPRSGAGRARGTPPSTPIPSSPRTSSSRRARRCSSAPAGTPLLLGALVLLTRLGMGDHLGPHRRSSPLPALLHRAALSLGVVGAGLGSTVVVQEREAGALEALKFSALGPAASSSASSPPSSWPKARWWSARSRSLPSCSPWGRVARRVVRRDGDRPGVRGHDREPRSRDLRARGQHRRSLLASLLGAGAVGIGVTTWLAFGSELGHWYGPFAVVQGYFEAPLDGANVALLFVIPAYALTTVLSLGRAAATSGLMDPSEDRSRPIKRWVLGTYSMGAILLFVCSRTAEPQSRGWIGGASMIAAASSPGCCSSLSWASRPARRAGCESSLGRSSRASSPRGASPRRSSSPLWRAARSSCPSPFSRELQPPGARRALGGRGPVDPWRIHGLGGRQARGDACQAVRSVRARRLHPPLRAPSRRLGRFWRRRRDLPLVGRSRLPVVSGRPGEQPPRVGCRRARVSGAHASRGSGAQRELHSRVEHLHRTRSRQLI